MKKEKFFPIIVLCLFIFAVIVLLAGNLNYKMQRETESEYDKPKPEILSFSYDPNSGVALITVKNNGKSGTCIVGIMGYDLSGIFRQEPIDITILKLKLRQEYEDFKNSNLNSTLTFEEWMQQHHKDIWDQWFAYDNQQSSASPKLVYNEVEVYLEHGAVTTVQFIWSRNYVHTTPYARPKS